MDHHLDEVVLSDRDRVVALSFLLWYYRIPAPDPQKAMAIQTRMQQLDPVGRWTSRRFRSALFR